MRKTSKAEQKLATFILCNKDLMEKGMKWAAKSIVYSVGLTLSTKAKSLFVNFFTQKINTIYMIQEQIKY